MEEIREVSILNPWNVMQSLQLAVKMTLDHADKNIQKIEGYIKCMRNLGLIDEKIVSAQPDVILVDKDVMIWTLTEYIENTGSEWGEGYKLCLHYLGIIK